MSEEVVQYRKSMRVQWSRLAHETFAKRIKPRVAETVATEPGNPSYVAVRWDGTNTSREPISRQFLRPLDEEEAEGQSLQNNPVTN